MSVRPITPAAALRERVEAMFNPGDRVAVLSDMESYVDRVLVAVRLPAAAFVMTIARAEYDGLAILRLLGFSDAPAKPAPHSIPKIPQTHARKKA